MRFNASRHLGLRIYRQMSAVCAGNLAGTHVLARVVERCCWVKNSFLGEVEDLGNIQGEQRTAFDHSLDLLCDV